MTLQRNSASLYNIWVSSPFKMWLVGLPHNKPMSIQPCLVQPNDPSTLRHHCHQGILVYHSQEVWTSIQQKSSQCNRGWMNNSCQRPHWTSGFQLLRCYEKQLRKWWLSVCPWSPVASSVTWFIAAEVIFKGSYSELWKWKRASMRIFPR